MSEKLDEFSSASQMANSVAKYLHPVLGLISAQVSVPAVMAQVMDDRL